MQNKDEKSIHALSYQAFLQAWDEVLFICGFYIEEAEQEKIIEIKSKFNKINEALLNHSANANAMDAPHLALILPNGIVSKLEELITLLKTCHIGSEKLPLFNNFYNNIPSWKM